MSQATSQSMPPDATSSMPQDSAAVPPGPMHSRPPAPQPTASTAVSQQMPQAANPQSAAQNFANTPPISTGPPISQPMMPQSNPAMPPQPPMIPQPHQMAQATAPPMGPGTMPISPAPPQPRPAMMAQSGAPPMGPTTGQPPMMPHVPPGGGQMNPGSSSAGPLPSGEGQVQQGMPMDYGQHVPPSQGPMPGQPAEPNVPTSN